VLTVDTGTLPVDSVPFGIDSADTGDSGTDLAYDTWTGTRIITVGDCSAEVTETGSRLDEDWVQYDVLVPWCDRCEHWYVLDVTPTEACGRPVDGYTFRGLHLGGARPEIYWMDEGAAEGGLYTEASWDGEALIYDVLLGESWHDGRVVLSAAE